jgi:hypothetical protein
MWQRLRRRLHSALDYLAPEGFCGDGKILIVKAGE